MKKLTVPLTVIAAVLLLLGLGFAYSGIFNVAADAPHWGITTRLIETTRARSINARARNVEVPPTLDDPQLLAMGAEHYDSMCTGCHLAPGIKDSEMRDGLYPKPPSLVERGAPRSAAETFWVIKHGIKMTGMPAWGVTHDDQSIWGMVAFLQKLPELSPAQYEEWVEQGRAPGHTHDGEESGHVHEDTADGHGHQAAGHDHGHDDSNTDDNSGAGSKTHEHGDGRSHSHSESKQSAATTMVVPAVAAEPVATVDRFFRNLAAGDTKGAAALLDPRVLIYESGRAERSSQEYASHHLGSDANFLKAVSHRLLSRTGDAVGDLAWVASETGLSGNVENKPTDMITTETMVLRKTSSGWRIIHIHWSNRSTPRGA